MGQPSSRPKQRLGPGPPLGAEELLVNPRVQEAILQAIQAGNRTEKRLKQMGVDSLPGTQQDAERCQKSRSGIFFRFSGKDQKCYVDSVSVAEMGSPVQAEQAAASSLERPKRRTSTSDASKLRLEIDEQPGYQQRLLFCPATTATSASAAVIAIWTA